MHDIIEHYGKVIVAMAGILAATLLTFAIISVTSSKTKDSVQGIEYESQVIEAVQSTTEAPTEAPTK